MKNKNIHESFTQKEIRDYLAKELEESREEGGFISIEYAEEQIKHFQDMLKYAKRFEVIKCLMAERGWEDWDISENITYNKETYFPFIGTEEEFNKLLELLKK